MTEKSSEVRRVRREPTMVDHRRFVARRIHSVSEYTMYTILLMLALLGTLAGKTSAETVYLRDGTVIKEDKIERIELSPRGQSLARGERLLMVGLGAGIPLKSQGFSRQAKADLAASVEAIWQMDPHWGVGVAVDGPGFATNYPSDDNFTRKSEVQAAAVAAVARWTALEARITPFAEAGLGFDSYYQLQERTNKATGQLTESHSVTGGAAALLGGGMQFLFGRRSLAQVGARWLYLQADKDKFPVNDAQAVELIASYGLRF